MNAVAQTLVLIGIVFIIQYVAELVFGRINRRAARDLAKTLGMTAEMDEHMQLIIEDLQRIQPEKEEILELAQAQMKAYKEQALRQQRAMEILGTKLPAWYQIFPVTKAAAAQARQHRKIKARSARMKELGREDLDD